MPGWVISYANGCLTAFSRQINSGYSSGVLHVQIGLFCPASLFVQELASKSVLPKLGGELGVTKGRESAHPRWWVKATVNVIDYQAHLAGLYVNKEVQWLLFTACYYNF